MKHDETIKRLGGKSKKALRKQQVSFQWKNPDFLWRNPDFL